MISFILLNNLNFSCCIGYPHAHVHKNTSRQLSLLKCRHLVYGTYMALPTQHCAQMPALLASFRFTLLILQLRSSVLNLYWMPPRNWRHLCKWKTSNDDKFISSRWQCNQCNSTVHDSACKTPVQAYSDHTYMSYETY